MSVNLHISKDLRILSLSFGHNGLFVNAFEVISEKGPLPKSWHTSYPWKDFLFPYWYKGGRWGEALLQEINQQLAFEYFPGSLPAAADRYIAYTTRSAGPFYNEFKQRFPSLDFIEGGKVDIVGLFQPFLENYAEKVVFVELNFMSIRIVEFSPRTFGAHVKWEYKLTELKFKDINELLSRVLRRGYLDFLTTTTPLNKLHNMFVNHLFYMPATTSDLDVIDFYRSVYFDIVAELSEQVGISKVEGGILIITGELPAFLQNKVSLILLVLDILGVRGTWACYFDEKLRVLPWMYAAQLGDFMTSEAIFDTWDLIYAPIGSKEVAEVTVFLDNTKYIGAPNEVYRFLVETKVNNFDVEDRYQLLFPEGIWVNSLVVDLRQRPVRYGRKLPDNRKQIKKWLASLTNLDKVNKT